MNNIKFIGRYLALGAAFAGMSTQAFAFQCEGTITCPPGGTSKSFERSHQVTDVKLGDTPGAITKLMEVDQFDVNAVAVLEGVDAADIDLKRVEVTLTVKPEKVFHTLTNRPPDWIPGDPPNDSCSFHVDWTHDVTILDNGITGELKYTGVYDGDSQNLNDNDTETWLLDNELPGLSVWPGWAGNEIAKTDCEALTAPADLAAFEGNGKVQWTLETLGVYGLTGCNDVSQGRTAEYEATVTVTYRYCVLDVPMDPTGCTCTQAVDYRRPGSILLFPEWDTTAGMHTLITVTNTNCMWSDPNNPDTPIDEGDVDVHFVYYLEDDCEERDASETLTSCDTITLLAQKHVADLDRGFMAAYAWDTQMTTPGNPVGAPINYNHLIGSVAVINGFDFHDYSVNAVSFQALNGIPRSNTDANDNGIRDLDGLNEYMPAPNFLTIPRFFGQDENPAGSHIPDPAGFNSELILIGLSGKGYETTYRIESWNDDEVPFSVDDFFTCWDKKYLGAISFEFENDFLHDGNVDDPLEIIGMPDREAGWMCIRGLVATKGIDQIQNPAIYAVLVEHYSIFGVADLPWECGIRTNGELW